MSFAFFVQIFYAASVTLSVRILQALIGCISAQRNLRLMVQYSNTKGPTFVSSCTTRCRCTTSGRYPSVSSYFSSRDEKNIKTDFRLFFTGTNQTSAAIAKNGFVGNLEGMMRLEQLLRESGGAPNQKDL